MFEDFISENDEVRIRTNVGSDVTGRLLQVDSTSRIFIVKPGDCEGSYHIPFDAVLCIRVDHYSQALLAG
jgi:hypothetical protein